MRSLAVFAALLVLGASPAPAHKLAPSLLALEQRADGSVEVLWRTPRIVARGTRLVPRLPEGCTFASSLARDATATLLAERSVHRCPATLPGLGLGVDGLEHSGTDVLVRVRLADGGESQTLLNRERPSWVIPVTSSGAEVASSYFMLGVEHLATGWDHLLFVAGLVLLVGASRRLVVAVTSFTLGHSITLALAALGFLSVSQNLTELAIAASLVVLARELLRDGPPSLIRRRPGLLCFAFGLVHGLGFAGALAELGIPGHAIPLALLFFNLGIEAGQLAVVGLWLAASLLVSRLLLAPPRWLVEAPATAIGALGFAWCLERLLGWSA